MTENGMIHVSITMKYFYICISNDTIKFLSKFALETNYAELVHQILNMNINSCINIVEEV